MTNDGALLLGSYLGALIGSFIEIGVFVVFYSYFGAVSFNLLLVVLYIILFSLVLAPILYINALRK